MGKEGYVYTGAGSLQETSIPSCQFCCEPKTPLKKKFLKTKADDSKNRVPNQNDQINCSYRNLEML